MLLANHSPAILTSVVPTCFAFYMMYKLLANSDGQFNLVTRPPLAFVQWAHVPRIPMNSLWISRAFLWFSAFTRIIVWWHWRTQLRRISPISGPVETRGNYKWGNSRLYIVSTNDRKRTVRKNWSMTRCVKSLNVNESFLRNHELPLGKKIVPTRRKGRRWLIS